MFLMKQGFTILSRNYRKKCGEIDVIAKKGKKIHFVEVKTVSCEISVIEGKSRVNKGGFFRAEENIHSKKLKSLYRTIEVYLSEMHVSENGEWQLDAHVVYLDVRNRRAKVDVIANITL